MKSNDSRLLLRSLKSEDVQNLRFLAETSHDEELLYKLSRSPFPAKRKNGFGIFILEKGKWRMIGYLEMEPFAKAYSVYGFIAKQYRRNHYMSSAFQTIFSSFPATCFYFDVDEKNLPAICCLERIGARVNNVANGKKTYYVKGSSFS